MSKPSRFSLVAFAFLVPSLPPAGADGPSEKLDIRSRTRGPDRVEHFEIRSPHQAAVTRVSVLVPDSPGKEMAAVYLLPVEAADQCRYGSGMEEARKRDLHNRHGVVLVAPTFSALPWYADHPTDPALRQETYLLRSVIPLVEQHFAVTRTAEGRLLLGFSKSGWGAWSLLMRYPKMFGRAAAWDAPLMMAQPGKYGSGPIFGTQQQFDAYCVSTLAERFAKLPGKSPRLMLLGYGNFRGEHTRMHQLLDSLKVPHVYRDGPPRKHDWHSGWVEEAMQLLVGQHRP